MSKFIITTYKDVEILVGNKYNTLEEAKQVATEILKQLKNDKSKSINDFPDEVFCMGYKGPVDNLIILEITPACFPDFGYMIFDGLADYSISEGNPDEEYPEATIKEQDELNELVTKWMTDKGYTPNWYNVEHSYLVELGENK